MLFYFLLLISPSAVILEPFKIKSLTVSIVSPSICHEVIGLDIFFWVLVVKGLVGLHRTVQLQLLQCYWLGHRLGLP